jgi:hypothetical protein
LAFIFVVLHGYPLAGPAWEEIKHHLAARYLESKGSKYAE